MMVYPLELSKMISKLSGVSFKCRNSKKEDPHLQADKSGLTAFIHVTEMTSLSLQQLLLQILIV